MSWQQTIIVGNCGRSPELRYLQSGTAVCDFSVAVSESWTDQQSGEKKEKVTWFKVSAWGKLAEVCNQYVVKGKQVMVVGTVEARAYLDKQNQPASSLDLRARDVRFLGGRDSAGAPEPDEGSEVIPF